MMEEVGEEHFYERIRERKPLLKVEVREDKKMIS